MKLADACRHGKDKRHRPYGRARKRSGPVSGLPKPGRTAGDDEGNEISGEKQPSSRIACSKRPRERSVHGNANARQNEGGGPQQDRGNAA